MMFGPRDMVIIPRALLLFLLVVGGGTSDSSNFSFPSFFKSEAEGGEDEEDGSGVLVAPGSQSDQSSFAHRYTQIWVNQRVYPSEDFKMGRVVLIVVGSVGP